MTNIKTKLEKLNISHSALDFNCGDDEINSYFERSFEEVESKNSQVYVLTTNSQIIGFFALSMASIRTDINGKNLKHPVCLIGQLGINEPFQKKGYGSRLIELAIDRATKISEDIGCKGVIIETYKPELIENFFKKKKFEKIDEKKLSENRIKHILFLNFKKNNL